MIKTIEELYLKAKQKEINRKLVLAAAEDKHALEAVYEAYKENMIDPVLTGNKNTILKLAEENGFDLSGIEIYNEESPENSVKKAVSLVNEGKADILMKGNVKTAVLLKGVLNDEYGLKAGNLLSHYAIFEIEQYHKLIGITDVAMNIAPDLREKVGIINNAVKFSEKIGITNPKIAVLTAVETVNEKMPDTVHAAVLSKMNQRKQIKNCIIDGPLAFDNAMSKEAAEHKGIVSDVAGDADILLAPDIEAGNILYKTLAFTESKLAAVILGAKAPIVLTSRSDSKESKLNSIVLAAVS